jgi:hypothetical protein
MVVPHDAIVAVASVGAPLQNDAGLRIKRKNSSTFHTICRVAHINATTTIASCCAYDFHYGATLQHKFAAAATINGTDPA